MRSKSLPLTLQTKKHSPSWSISRTLDFKATVEVTYYWYKNSPQNDVIFIFVEVIFLFAYILAIF